MSNNNEIDNIILNLSRIKGFGPVTIKSLLAEDNFDDPQKLIDYLVFESKVQKSLLAFEDKRFYVNLSKKGIKLISYLNKSYPRLLKEIPDPPPVLFYKGNINIANNSRTVSIVGTRRNTDYGERAVRYFGESWVRSSTVIVSGMAMGVDALAHSVALDNGGKTIAVLAGSPHIANPMANYKIHKQIIENDGLVFSEYIPGTKIFPGMFASRNRIIAGLSLNTVVIEAGLKSGASITAKLAFDYNREVYAVPGDFNRESSKGCNQLIMDSIAKPLIHPHQLFGQTFHENSEKPKSNYDFLTEDQSIVCRLLETGPMFVDEMQSLTNLSLYKILSVCSVLELNKLVNKDIAGRYKLA